MNIKEILNEAFDMSGVLKNDKHRKFIIAQSIKKLSCEYEKYFNEKIQDILSSGYSLHNDSNKWIIQSTGYGDKDFTTMEWNGDNQKEFDTVDKAIKFINKKGL